ncbi:integrator complex subunit 5 [Strongylocentrotus purpuratus]|uniref:Integrator complex subunit 5 n=1 Tax=Strongylocentrotus purpuratus TaxID=7668 RepID=A0A7M7PR69_STRPU|nr:integrator complex subunit 5 [Strongylocentrotus purpuratus]
MDSEEAREILFNVRTFVKGVDIRNGRKLSSEEHARCALHLLQTLPAARTAVLDFLCHVFDESVNLYLYELEGEGASSMGLHLDELIEDIYKVLKKLIEDSPTAWSPILSAWSIALLGQISSNYASRRGVPHPSNLNELLQLWMTCKATRTIMDLATHCIAAMSSSCPDPCVDALLNTSVQHSPHFDWVVAHIGSCFPTTIITRVLSCGLKDFCSSQSSEGQLIATETKVPKVASVVGILGHLTSQHSQDIRKALLDLFQESLDGKKDHDVFTVPFLLQLATMSPMLLKIITTDFVQALTPEVLNRISEQFRDSTVLKRDRDSLLTLVIHLICRSGNGAFNLLLFLLDTGCDDQRSTKVKEGSKVNKMVQYTCALVLDLLLLDLQRSAYSQSGNLSLLASPQISQESGNIPFLNELQKHTSLLCDDIISSQGRRVGWLQRILSLISVQSGESCASDILSFILINESNPAKIGLYISILTEIETSYPSVLPAAIQKSVNQLQRTTPKQTLQLLTNLNKLLSFKNSTHSSKMTSNLRTHLTRHLQMIASQLHHGDLGVACQTVDLLKLIGLPELIDMSTLLCLCQSSVEFFFAAMHSADTMERLKTLETCSSYLTFLCSHTTAQSIVLRSLLVGSVQVHNSQLFANASNHSAQHPQSRSQSSMMESSLGSAYLLKHNQKFSGSLTVPRSASTAFHSGIIGQGARKKLPGQAVSDIETKQTNSRLLVEAISSCAHVRPRPAPLIKAGNTHLLPLDPRAQGIQQASRQPVARATGKLMAETLMEILCPDVSHSEEYWPDEEMIKHTIERDLSIKKRVDEYPFTWDVLEIISRAKPALCYCSGLLYSVMATLISHWESSRDETAGDSKGHLLVTCRLVHCMNLAGFLPPPLNQCHPIFSELTPREVYVLLSNIWAFLTDNPPIAEVFIETDEQGLPSRAFPQELVSKYAEVVRSLVHRSIHKFGHLYAHLCPVPTQI